MIYFGRVAPEHRRADLGVDVIDPTLPVDWASPDFAGHSMDYWPSYDSISPQSRAAYLMWLQGGRSAPNTYIGYVFLFFYGLERRTLVDAQRDPAARADLPYISAEVVRLLRLYGENRSFRGYATDFQQLLQFMLNQGDPNSAQSAPDPAAHDHWEPPFDLRTGLGSFALQGSPVPVEWARSWAMLHPHIHPRTPATRCAAEFGALFASRYRARFGDGMVVRPVRQRLTLPYRPASAALADVEITVNVPDVLTAPEPTRVLAELVETCTNDLDAYSRLLGRRPDAADSLPAQALLPTELLGEDLAALRPLKTLVAHCLPDDAPQGVVDMAELVALWPARMPGRFGKPDAVGVAQLLEKLGVGIEPDVRLGGPVQTDGPAVLFRTVDHQPVVATAEYGAATTLLHLAAVVSAADDDVSMAERDHLIHHLESSLHLSPGERVRLTAHLAWLLVSQVKLTGMKKRLTGLTGPQREHVAEFATTIAAIDGRIAPGEIKTLRRIYTLLELDPETLFPKLHSLAAGVATSRQPPAHEPVTVIERDTRPSGYAIPREPEIEPDGGLRLDQSLIRAKMAETAAVAALLADVFEEEPGTTGPAENALSTGPAPADLVATLDAAHSTLLRRLAERPTWESAAFEDLCASLDLLPEGALDTINEVAIEITEEPVVEGDGPQLRINDYALGELLV